MVLQSEYGALTRMEYTAPTVYEIHLLVNGTVTFAATWTGNTYYIECYGLGDDTESPELADRDPIGRFRLQRDPRLRRPQRGRH